MTQDEIIRMAREAGFLVDNALFLESVSLFERFAAIAAANEREKQAEQEPVAWRCVIPRRTWTMGVNWGREYFENEEDTHGLQGVEPLYAAPVRTKDLTDDEIEAIMVEQGDLRTTVFARAVIAADREKNK